MTQYKLVSDVEQQPFVKVRISEFEGETRALVRLSGDRSEENNPRLPGSSKVKEGLALGKDVARDLALPMRVELNNVEWNSEWGELVT